MALEFNEKRILMDGEEMEWVTRRLSLQVIEDNPKLDSLCIMGIRKRGDILAERVSDKLKESTEWDIKVGVLDITLYRDDLTTYGPKPIVGSTHFPCSIDDMDVLLVDDVIHTGRTIRSALDEIIDYGRPSRIRLAVMVDRSGRELPIYPDYRGISVDLTSNEEVRVKLKETDGEDSIIIVEVKDESR